VGGHVLEAAVKEKQAVPSAAVLLRELSPQVTEAVRLVCLGPAQIVKAKFLQEALPALTSRRVAAAHQALVSHVRTVKANHLLELLSRQEARVRVCLAEPAKPPAWARRQAGSRQ